MLTTKEARTGLLHISDSLQAAPGGTFIVKTANEAAVAAAAAAATVAAAAYITHNVTSSMAELSTAERQPAATSDLDAGHDIN